LRVSSLALAGQRRHAERGRLRNRVALRHHVVGEGLQHGEPAVDGEDTDLQPREPSSRQVPEGRLGGEATGRRPQSVECEGEEHRLQGRGSFGQALDVREGLEVLADPVLEHLDLVGAKVPDERALPSRTTRSTSILSAWTGTTSVGALAVAPQPPSTAPRRSRRRDRNARRSPICPPADRLVRSDIIDQSVGSGITETAAGGRPRGSDEQGDERGHDEDGSGHLADRSIQLATGAGVSCSSSASKGSVDASASPAGSSSVSGATARVRPITEALRRRPQPREEPDIAALGNAVVSEGSTDHRRSEPP
jgi:hypothetical protein